MSTFTRKWADFKPGERVLDMPKGQASKTSESPKAGVKVSDTPKNEASETSESPTSHPFAGFAGPSVGHSESFSCERTGILRTRLLRWARLGQWPIRDVDHLIDCLERAQAGDNEARAAVDDYLKEPAVIQALKAW